MFIYLRVDIVFKINDTIYITVFTLAFVFQSVFFTFILLFIYLITLFIIHVLFCVFISSLLSVHLLIPILYFPALSYTFAISFIYLCASFLYKLNTTVHISLFKFAFAFESVSVPSIHIFIPSIVLFSRTCVCIYCCFVCSPLEVEVFNTQ